MESHGIWLGQWRFYSIHFKHSYGWPDWSPATSAEGKKALLIILRFRVRHWISSTALQRLWHNKGFLFHFMLAALPCVRPRPDRLSCPLFLAAFRRPAGTVGSVFSVLKPAKESIFSAFLNRDIVCWWVRPLKQNCGHPFNVCNADTQFLVLFSFLLFVGGCQIAFRCTIATVWLGV